MRTAVVVGLDPIGCQFSHLVQTFKDIHIEDRLTICPVKAFDIAVLHRASGLDEFEIHTIVFSPVGDGDGSELRPVVESDPLRQSSRFGNTVEHSYYPAAADVEVNLDGQYLAPVVVNHVEGAEPAPFRQRVRPEISRQALILALRNAERFGCLAGTDACICGVY